MEPNLLCSWLCGLLDFSHLAPVGTGWSLGGRALRGKVFMVLLPRKGRQPVSGLFQGLRWGPRADGLSSPMRPETESPRAGGGGSWDRQLLQSPFAPSKNRIGCLYKLNSWEVPKGKGFPGKESRSWKVFVLFFFLMMFWLMTQGNEEHISLRISGCPSPITLHSLFKTFKPSHFLQEKVQPPSPVLLFGSGVAFSSTCLIY